MDELNDKMINTTNLNCFSCVENNDINKMVFLRRKRKMQRSEEDKFMKYFNDDEDDDEDKEEEKKINDKFDDIYDDLILKKGEQNNKERSYQFHGNEDGDLSGIYLQEDEFAD